MSTQDESGVYYTPFPNQHLNNGNIQQHQGFPQNAFKQCSVKGCTDMLPSDDTNKMCDGCRSRHRIYASTKRARRKLEKAAMVTSVVACSGKDLEEMSLIDHIAQPISWVTAGQSQDLQPSTSLSSLSTWNVIDPRLFSADVSPPSAHHLSPPMPHQTSTSSELANALTPRHPSTPVSVPASVPSQTVTDYSKHYNDLSATLHPQDPHTSVADDNEEQVISLQVAAVQDQQMGVSSSERQTSSETADRSQGRSSDEIDGTARICSVKGCKAVIRASYEYKMCPPCRTRYRTYGNTKRAKWKAEREAFDREMATLTTVEDEKKKANGLGPLAESPQELRAWELSIANEQVPADSNIQLPETSTAAEPGLAQPFSPSPALIPGMNPSITLAGVYPASISSSTADSPNAISPYFQLNNNALLASAASTSLPARMCTVSHCHKILPGYYRYKRCEQHRLQNRHHSQLKRVREKEVKAVEPVGTTEAGGGTDKEQETMQATVAVGEKEAGISPADTAVTGGVADKIKSHDQKRSKFSCSAGDCHNLLQPSVRWRLCEPCRSIDRRHKNQIKFEQKAAREKNEKMNTDPQTADISKSAAEGNGEAQESQETNHAISAGAVDSDAEGDIDMGENEDETEQNSKPVENQQTIVVPVGPPSVPPAAMTSGFSRFHVTIDPRNASSATALDPTTSTAKLVTLDDPLAFRAYRPKTTPSAIGRILARNPGLSVEAFTEVLQAESANTGVITLSQPSSTCATTSLITPTIPISAPFVYKAPEKKFPSTRITARKAKRKAASSETQSNFGSTAPAAPAPAPTPTPAPAPTPVSTSGLSDSTVSAPPGSYGSYGYQYPYPYPYYMPSPYSMPPYPYPQAPPSTLSETKSKRSSKSSTSTATPSSAAIPGYSSYPYPYPPSPYGYPPPPNGYPYMPTRYVPGQQPLPLGTTSPYPYPYHRPPVPTPTPVLPSEKQRSQDAKFNYYHYGTGSSYSPTTPNDKKRKKRRKVDPDYLEKFKAQTEAISISLAMDQAKRGVSSPVPTLPATSVASGSSNTAPPIISAPPVQTVEAPSKPVTSTRLCANKTCHRSLADTVNTLCDKCRLRFKKHQAKTKKRFKLEPRKSLLIAVSERHGLVEEREHLEK